MDLTLEQLNLTKVNKNITPLEQQEQWSKELKDWFNGFETIKIGDNYITEARVVQIPEAEFNKIFNTNFKYKKE